MNQPYLILHKVRGEPAFDIAERIEIAGKEGWHIPTSGHGAHPFREWPVDELRHEEGYILPYTWPNMSDHEGWFDLPDHYHCNNLKKPKVTLTTASALLAKLGLGAKPIGRRKV